jgi:hypothetical protein
MRGALKFTKQNKLIDSGDRIYFHRPRMVLRKRTERAAIMTMLVNTAKVQ